MLKLNNDTTAKHSHSFSQEAISFYLLTFASSTNAMAAKKALESSTSAFSEVNTLHDHETLKNSSFRLIPIPPEIDASCGLCMRIENKNSEKQGERQHESLLKVWNALSEKKVPVKKIYGCKNAKEGLLCTILTMPQQQ